MEREHRNLFFYEGVIISFDPGEDPDFTKLTIYGKSTQDGTPTPEAPVDIVSVGDDGSLVETVTGKNLVNPTVLPYKFNGSASTFYSLRPLNSNDLFGQVVMFPILSSAIYTISGDNWTYMTGGNLRWALFDQYPVANVTESIMQGYNSSDFTLTTPNTAKYMALRVETLTAAERDIVIETLQVELGAITTAYEPYKGSTATLTTGLPLCGIPVSEGGNVTIDGQQYIADTIEVNADGTGKVVKRTSIIDSYADEAVETAYLSTTGELSTGAKVIYGASAPTEIPLTAAEVQSILSMQTFSPVTNVYNDEGAWQKLEGILWEADV